MGDDLDATVRMTIDPNSLDPRDQNNLKFMKCVEGAGARSPTFDVLNGGLAAYVGKTVTHSAHGPVHHYTGFFPRHEGMIQVDVERCRQEYSAGVKVMNQDTKLNPKITDPIGIYRLLEKLYEGNKK
jgi:hypothetical protein